MIPQDALKTLANRYSVSDTEFAVLSLVIDGKSMADIAEALKIDAAAVRKRLGEVYRKFEIGGKGPGKLPRLQQLLMAQYQQQERSASSLLVSKSGSKPQAGTPELPPPIWDGIAEVDAFYGRSADMKELQDWLTVDRCRLIEVLGIGGIGKTTLSLELAKRVRREFDQVIYRPLIHAPSLKELLADLLSTLSGRQERSHSEQPADQLTHLLVWMQQNRCLLILDGAENILRSDELAGQYRAGYQDYSTLFKQIATTEHQSCLVVTSTEKTQEFPALEGTKVRAFHLQGLTADEGRGLFKAKGIFSASEQEWQTITQLYGGNPLALKIAAVTILEVFSGNLSEFLKQETIVFGGIHHLIEHQVNRLSRLEKHIMYWLTLSSEPISLQELRDDMVPCISYPKLLEALESLGHRSLVERDNTMFLLQPVIQEYITSRIIERVCEEIGSDQINRFNSHALIKAQAKDYIRERQIERLLKPLLEKLLAQFEHETALKQRLLALLTNLQRTAPLKPGYAAGNALNLLWQLGADVSDCDFSRLSVRQAYLKDIALHRVNFASADLAKSVFAEKLGSILSIAFTPDGSLLATGDTDGYIRLWQVATGEQVATWPGHEDWVRSVSFSPDGQMLVSGSEDKTIRLWQVETGQCLLILDGHRSWLRSVVFSPDGTTLASSSDDKTVRLWEVNSGRCLKILEKHTKVVRTVAFSPDGQHLATGSSDRTIRLWEIGSGECLRVLQQHSRGVRSVSFSPDGQMLASGSSDCTIKLWDVATGECFKSLSGHRGWVWSVVFSPDGQMLASGSEDQTVRLWQIETGESRKMLQGHTSWVRSVKFSPDGRMLASGSDDQTVRLWDVNSGQRLKTLQGYARGIRSVAFSADGQLLASGSEDQTVRIWQTAAEQCLMTLSQHKGRVWSVAFNPANNRILASGSEDLSIRIWDVSTGECLKTLSGHQDGVHSVAFTPDGQILASGSADQTVRLWDVTTGQCLATLSGHSDWVWSVAFSPDGQTLASGSSDLTVRLWNIQTRQWLTTLTGHNHWIRSVAFSPDGQTLASSSVGRMVRIWDVKTGKNLKILDGFKNGIRSVAFSPDSRALASGSDDRVVRLWDIQSGRCLQTFEGHADRVRSVAFSLDGKTLASGSNDETIKLWNVKTGKELTSLRLDRLYEGMNITGALNLTPSQRLTLIALGAVDEKLPCR